MGFRDTVVVAGCGPLGLGMVAAARLKSPATLIALDLFNWKVDPLHPPPLCLIEVFLTLVSYITGPDSDHLHTNWCVAYLAV